jgi:hypothetical protein
MTAAALRQGTQSRSEVHVRLEKASSCPPHRPESMLELNVEAPTPLAVLPSLRLVIGILSAAASAGYPEEVAGGAMVWTSGTKNSISP